MGWGSVYMSKLSEFFGRKGDEAQDVDSAVLRFPSGSKDAAETDMDQDVASLADLSSHLGEENEALRNLLVDAGRRLTELDEARQGFLRIVEPANRALRALEQEKTHNISLRRALSQTRANGESLQSELHKSTNRVGGLERDNERLRQEIELARQAAREIETSRAEFSNELSIKRAEVAELGRQRSQEAANARALVEELQKLRDDTNLATGRIGQLETDLTVSREKLLVAEGENRSLRSSYEQTAAELSRTTQRAVESENAHATARTRLEQLESGLKEANDERKKLRTMLEEANERHRAEHHASTMQIGALQARVSATEGLLGQTRQLGIARSEEARAADRRATEAVFARNKLEKKFAEYNTSHQAMENQVKELEQSRATLIERCGALINALKVREAQAARAEEKIDYLTDRLTHFEDEMQVSRTALEKRIDELNMALEGERLDHSVAQGALEAARKDRAELQRELQRLNVLVRRGVRSDGAPALEAKEDAAPNPTPAASAQVAPPATAFAS